MKQKKAKTESHKAKPATHKTKTESHKSHNSIEKMKYEIANEFGVNLGPDTSARKNGKVGGEITKRLVEKGLSKHSNSSK